MSKSFHHYIFIFGAKMPPPDLQYNWTELSWVVVSFVVVTLCAAIPFLIVYTAYPKFLIDDVGQFRFYYDISDFFVNDFAYVGIGVFVSYFFYWISVAPPRVSRTRKHYIYLFRAFSLLAAIVCFTNYQGWHSEYVIMPKTIEFYSKSAAQGAKPSIKNDNSSAADYTSSSASIFPNETQLRQFKAERKFGIFWSVMGTLLLVLTASLAQTPLVSRRRT